MRLEAHIHHEERVLFRGIEEALSEDELQDLSAAVGRAERRLGDGEGDPGEA